MRQTMRRGAGRSQGSSDHCWHQQRRASAGRLAGSPDCPGWKRLRAAMIDRPKTYRRFSIFERFRASCRNRTTWVARECLMYSSGERWRCGGSLTRDILARGSTPRLGGEHLPASGRVRYTFAAARETIDVLALGDPDMPIALTRPSADRSKDPAHKP